MALDPSALEKAFAAKRREKEPAAPKPEKSRGTVARKDSLPESPDAESGVLAVMLQYPDRLAEVCRSVGQWHFNSPARRTIFQALSDLHDSGGSVGLIELTQSLIDKGKLAEIGGPGVPTDLQTLNVGAGAGLEDYLGILRQKLTLREMIRTGQNMARAAHGMIEGDDVEELVGKFGSQIERIKHHASGPNGSERFDFSDLMAFDSTHDPNCLVGNRYIVRGGSSLWAGGSGYGKSSLLMQLAIYWACGRSWCNLRPVRPLKSLIIQAENDRGDMSEQLQGVINGVNAIGDIDVQGSRDLIEKNIGIHRVIAKTGHAFLDLLDSLCQVDRPDIAWIDPLFAFAGCDLMNAKETGRFLREGLFAIADKRKVALNVIHHAGKPSRENGSEPTSEIDFQYLGFGTSEIQNAFRAVNVLVPVSAGIFRLILSKRGDRARAKDVEGNWTRQLFLQQGKEGITWTQCEAPEPDSKPGTQKFSTKDVLSELSVVHPVTTKIIQQRLYQEKNMSRATFYRLLGELQKDEKVIQTSEGWTRKGLVRS